MGSEVGVVVPRARERVKRGVGDRASVGAAALDAL